jgi:hypothetical protein
MHVGEQVVVTALPGSAQVIADDRTTTATVPA